MLKKLLASIRIGGAKIDTTLEKEEYRQGEIVHGRVVIQGGAVQQEINHMVFQIKIRLRARGEGLSGIQDFIWHKHELTDRIVIEPREEKEIPFSFQLPEVTPISFPYDGHFHYTKPKLAPYRFQAYIQTGVDIEDSIDPSDHDEIQVAPHPHVEQTLRIMHRMGFSVFSLEPNGVSYPTDRAFYQEFLFRIPELYKSWLEEVSLAYLGKGHFVLTLDPHNHSTDSIMNMFDLDEKKIRFTVIDDDLDDDGRNIQEFLTQQIDYYYQRAGIHD